MSARRSHDTEIVLLDDTNHTHTEINADTTVSHVSHVSVMIRTLDEELSCD
jgi:hypothetical protein